MNQQFYVKIEKAIRLVYESVLLKKKQGREEF